MLKTEQILNAKFTPVSTGTYSAAEVDNFLKAVAESYEQNNQEKNSLIKKLGFLADKVEAYRKDEEAIKSALLDAHKMADSVNKEAQIKADKLIVDADSYSKTTIDEANTQKAQIIDAARVQAKEIVDNAKAAVSSLTERAQAETQAAINAAKTRANEIIVNANQKSEEIIGNSKSAYDFYVSELAKIKNEVSSLKTRVDDLFLNQPIYKEEIFEFNKREEAIDNYQTSVEPATVKIDESINDEVIEEPVLAPAEDEKIPEAVETEITEEISNGIEDLLGILDDDETADINVTNSESDEDEIEIEIEEEIEEEEEEEVTEIKDIDLGLGEFEIPDSNDDDDDFLSSIENIDDIISSDTNDLDTSDEDITSLFESLFD